MARAPVIALSALLLPTTALRFYPPRPAQLCCSSTHANRPSVRAAHMRMQVGEESTLAELRAFVRDQGLDVKTSGPGRTKKAILKDVLAEIQMGATGAPVVEESAPVPTAPKAASPPPAKGAAARASDSKNKPSKGKRSAKAKSAAPANQKSESKGSVEAAESSPQATKSKAAARTDAPSNQKSKPKQQTDAASSPSKASDGTDAPLSNQKSKPKQQAEVAASQVKVAAGTDAPSTPKSKRKRNQQDDIATSKSEPPTVAAEEVSEEVMGRPPDGFDWGGVF
ncbi:MAG: hypothetical protein SGPRY_000414 [Prymnesium sp.]